MTPKFLLRENCHWHYVGQNAFGDPLEDALQNLRIFEFFPHCVLSARFLQIVSQMYSNGLFGRKSMKFHEYLKFYQ